MKIFEGIRQSGQTYNMITDIHMKLRRDSLLPNGKKNFLILIVTPKLNVSIQLREQIIERIWGKANDLERKKVDEKTIRLIDSSLTYDFMIARDDEVTLADLKTPDYVIIDDVFTHHPYNERIMIRGTVDPV